MPQIPILGLAADTIDRKAQASRNKKAGADPNKPLAAQPTKGLNTQIDTLDEKTGNRRMPSLGKGLYRHTLELDNGIVYEFDATRKLSEAEQDQELAYYVTTPEYKQKVAQIEGQRAKRANTPASELGPYDTKRVAQQKKEGPVNYAMGTTGNGRAPTAKEFLDMQDQVSANTQAIYDRQMAPENARNAASEARAKGRSPGDLVLDNLRALLPPEIGGLNANDTNAAVTEAQRRLRVPVPGPENMFTDLLRGIPGALVTGIPSVASSVKTALNPNADTTDRLLSGVDAVANIVPAAAGAKKIAKTGVEALNMAKGMPRAAVNAKAVADDLAKAAERGAPIKGVPDPLKPAPELPIKRTQVGPSPMQMGPMAGATVEGRRAPMKALPAPESKPAVSNGVTLEAATQAERDALKARYGGATIPPTELTENAFVAENWRSRAQNQLNIAKRSQIGEWSRTLKEQGKEAGIKAATEARNAEINRLTQSLKTGDIHPQVEAQLRDQWKAANPSAPVVAPPKVKKTKANVSTESKLGNPNEKAINEGVRDVQSGQGKGNEGKQFQGQGNGQKANAKKEVTVEPPPVIKTGETPDSVAPPKQTTTPSAEPQTTGVSNRAQLSDAEKGLLMEDPKGKGRSAEDIYNANRNRTDYQNVAAEVAKGRPFSSDDAAAVIAGNRTLTAKVKDAADELDHAINNKQSQSIIDQRREALRSALEEKQQFVDNIQKGKSQWSDTGRVFGIDTRIDNGDIGQVLGEARRWKGSDLNSKEVAQLTKAVEEHARRVKVVEAELKAAQEKIAEKATQNMRAKAGPKPTPDRIADIRKRRADASQRLSRSFGQMNLNIPTETVGAIYDIAKTYVEEYGIVKPQELIKRMRDDHAALKGISDADILESIATAGNPGRVAKTRSEVAQNLAQLRKEAAAAMGNPEKIKAINAKIADLEDQISTGNFKMPKARTKAAPGSELELAQIRLQESRARVNAAIRAREPKSAGQKVAGFLRETALANPIARLQDLNSNLWSAADNTTWSPIDRALANRISKSAGGEGVAGKVGWNKTRNERVFRNYGASIKAEMAGSNSKFLSDGHYLKPSTWAGATDAPFRVAYERGAWSDLADSFAKRTGKDSESAFRQLVNEEYTPGPMNHADWKAGREAGTKIADRLTYNNENPASALSSKVKEAIRHYQKHGTPSQQATAQYMEPAVDNILRFSKVIYNVAADRLQRSGSGVLKGASRHIRGIRAAEAMTTEEAMYIARLYRKGATGALTTYAAYLYAKYQMPDGQTGSQHFPGELVKTKSGKVYVDFGSFEQIAVFAPILFGVGIARLEKLPTHNGKTDSGGEGVTESQKKDAWLNMLTDLVTNQPLFSGPERIIKATQSESGMKGYAASVALGAIPGASAIRGIANLVDESKGIRYRSAQTPMDKAKLLLPWWMRDEVAPAENKLPERLRK